MRPWVELAYPVFSGCYALVSAGRVVYVGKSISVLSRLNVWRNKLRRHQEGKRVEWVRQSPQIIHFDRVRIYPCPVDEMDEFEKELILLYDPPLNVRKPPRRKVDIMTLAIAAGLDIESWKKRGTEEYQRPQAIYRRM